MSAYRWPCSVLGCRCTVGSDEPYEGRGWAVCSKHWRMVPRQVKRVLRRKERLREKYAATVESYQAPLVELVKAFTTREPTAAEKLEEKRLSDSVWFFLAHQMWADRAYDRITRRMLARLNERALGI